MQVRHRRRHHHQLTLLLHPESIARTDPETVDSFLVVMERVLIGWRLCDEEPGVESPTLSHRSDPMINVVRRGQIEDEIIAAAEFNE